jgi:hypothetical protein
MKRIVLVFIVSLVAGQLYAQSGFNGLDMNMGNLYRLSDAKTHSISPENFTGEKAEWRFRIRMRSEILQTQPMLQGIWDKDGGMEEDICRKNPTFLLLHSGTRLNLIQNFPNCRHGKNWK